MVQQLHHLRVYTGIIKKHEKHYGAVKEPKVVVTYRLTNPLEQSPSLDQQNAIITYEYLLTLST